jgi:hypothetical protein
MGLRRKFAAKSSGWDENRIFFEGDVREAEVCNGRWVLTRVPAGPRPAPPPAQHFFRPRSDGVTGYVTSSYAAATRGVTASLVIGRKAGAVQVSLDEQDDRVGGVRRVLVCRLWIA